MAWAERSEKSRVALTLEQLEAKEKFWNDSPITEYDRWVKDFAACHYELDGEYEIDADRTLLRFKWIWPDADMVEWQTHRYHNVTLSKKMRPYTPFDTTFGSKK